MSVITKYASIVGMMVVGAMSMEMVTINFLPKIGIGNNSETIQSLLDGIFPGLASLSLFAMMYWMIQKKINPLLIMLIILVVSIVLAYFKILGS